MKAIDKNQLEQATGGVVDSGDGQGCTRPGGTTLPFPRPSGLPGSEPDGWPPIRSGIPGLPS